MPPVLAAKNNIEFYIVLLLENGNKWNNAVQQSFSFCAIHSYVRSLLVMISGSAGRAAAAYACGQVFAL